MEDWVFRRDLIDNRRLRALSRRSDLKGAVQYGSLLLALCATGTGLYLLWGGWWGVPLFFVHGVLLWSFTYSGQHELLHRTPFRSRRLNDLAVRLTGFFRLWPPDHERFQHFGHHRHTKDPAHDPELIGARPLSLPRYLWRLGGQGYWWSKGGTFLRTAIGAVSKARHPEDWLTRITDAATYFNGEAAPPEGITPFDQLVVEGETPSTDLETIRAMIDSLRNSPGILDADLLGDDRLEREDESTRAPQQKDCERFAVELTLPTP